MTEHVRISLIGTGRMGSAMVERLTSHGATMVIFNRTRAKAEQVAAATGASIAPSAAEAVSNATHVIVSLADDQALEDIYLNPQGIVEGLQPGTVLCETSTVDPGTIHRLGDAVAVTGASLIDSPVSGSVSTVREGSLTILAGGDAATVDSARQVLALMSRHIIHTGPLGTGATMKLALNSAVHGLNAALAEALVLAEQAGIARSTAYDVFQASVLGSPFVSYKREAFEHPASTPVAFTLELLEKDLRLVTGLAARLGVSLRQAETNRRMAVEAIRMGYGSRDMSAVGQILHAHEPVADTGSPSPIP